MTRAMRDALRGILTALGIGVAMVAAFDAWRIHFTGWRVVALCALTGAGLPAIAFLWCWRELRRYRRHVGTRGG